MKILQLLPTLSAGGAEGFITNLGVNMAELGAEIKYFLLAGVRKERGHLLLARLKNAGIKVTGIRDRNIRSVMNILELTKIIKTWQPDIVQANLFSAEVMLAAASIIGFNDKTKYVRRLADSKIVSKDSSILSIHLLEKFYHLDIACSVAVENAYNKLTNNTYKEKLITIPNGGYLQKNTTTAAEKYIARKELQIPTTDFVIAHIGRFSEDIPGEGLSADQKAHDVLLRAFADAFAGDPSKRLLMLGDGSTIKEAMSLSDALSITAQTTFIKHLSEPWLLLKAADMFCFPSRYEGLPNVLPEAASCGLPILASDIPEISYISPDNAWLLKPVDNILAFSSGMKEIKQNYSNFKKVAEEVSNKIRDEFSMKNCAQKYLDTYKALFV